MPKNVRAKKLTSAQQRDLDVEISFLEGLMGRDPNWTDALKLLADNYTRRGRVHDGLRVDQQLIELCPDDPYAFYNLACSYSLSKQFDAAFAALDRAFKLGYDDFKWLAKDPDMANLRRHPDYKEFLAKLGAAK